MIKRTTSPISQETLDIKSKQKEILYSYEQRLKKTPSPEIICIDAQQDDKANASAINDTFSVPNKVSSSSIQQSQTNDARAVPRSSQSFSKILECEFCLVDFNGGLVLQLLMNHLKDYHNISNPHELSQIIRRALLKNQQSQVKN